MLWTKVTSALEGLTPYKMIVILISKVLRRGQTKLNMFIHNIDLSVGQIKETDTPVKLETLNISMSFHLFIHVKLTLHK